jgi:tRNA threonylcarbamoyladenosine biosynthesis protein TsaE
MATFTSNSPEQTQALGEEWGRSATSGLVIWVGGDLGAGKTQLAKGLARGLGFAGRVHSPTFALINQYEGGRLPLYHLDLYRLQNEGEILSAGLEEYFRPQGITLVEWAERWVGEQSLAEMTPPQPGFKGRLVRIEVPDENSRRIIYEDFGT